MRLASAVSVLLGLMLACGPKEKVKGLQVRVVWDQDPSTQARVVWTVPNASAKSSVELIPLESSNKPINPDTQTEPVQYNNSRLFEVNANPYMVAAQFKNLNPNQKYKIKVAIEGGDSESYWFRTAPVDNSYSLLLGGDSRSDHDVRRYINSSIKLIVEENPEIIAFVHGGDYIADGNDWRQWQMWLNDYRLTYQKEGRILPIIPTRGNHETDKVLYNQVFGFSEDSNGYFKTRIGELDLITLNSEESISGTQFNWLESELAQSKQDGQWIFTNYHRPAYPAVKRPGETKKWVPLFEKYGVRVAFESDGHTFKQTLPIYEEKKDDSKGVIYLGEGGLGVKQRRPHNHRWYLNDGGIAFKQHHFIYIQKQDSKIKIEALDEDGNSFHELQLSRR